MWEGVWCGEVGKRGGGEEGRKEGGEEGRRGGGEEGRKERLSFFTSGN